VFWLPLSQAIGIDHSVKCAGMTLITALFARTCDWRIADLGWMYTLFFVFLGLSAAIWGGWLEKVGPRRAGVVSALCWCGGLLISALGIYLHQLWMMWLGSGVIGGIGLGLGYISPVSTLIKWFPDRRGMATGMAIMGFGGGAMIGSPLATLLMNHYHTPASVGVWQTFVTLAAGYFIFMLAGAFGYRLPPPGWKPEGWSPPANNKAMIADGHVHLNQAHKTPQFWLIWAVLCLNVSAGIGIIGIASPMLQEIFGGALAGDAALSFDQVQQNESLAGQAALVAAGFVGLISLFNIFGRIFWASSSDKLGRKLTYYTFFALGAVCYAIAPFAAEWKNLALFVGAFCLIASMYGGGFATVPAYLADVFGTQFVGAIHGRLLTAWSTAGIVGPVIVNYMREARLAAGVPRDQLYDPIFYVLAGLLVAGFVANLLIRPLHKKWFMTKAEVEALQEADRKAAERAKAKTVVGSIGGFDFRALLAWSAVGIPLAWGVWITLQKALVLFM
jgi:MFS family permease